MATQPEAKLTKKIVDHINARPRSIARKVHQSRFQAGQPDVDGCVVGRAVKIEVKVPGNVPTDLQMTWMRRWADAGALVGWCTSVDEVIELLSHVSDPDWVNPQLAR